jgi:hypothetical protein
MIDEKGSDDGTGASPAEPSSGERSPAEGTAPPRGDAADPGSPVLPQTGGSSDRQHTAKRRRVPRYAIWSGLAVAVLGLLAVLVFVAPRHIARYVVADQLSALDIQAEGVGTLDVDLWNQQVWFGPVEFRASDADPGQVGQFGLKWDLFNLFKRRAIVETLIVEGISIHVNQEADGSITLNGISLKQKLAEETAEATTAAAEAAPPKEGGWGAGLDSFELLSSRVVFTNQRGGRLEAELDRLALAGFRTWTPDQPGTYDLQGRVNGIKIEARGEARPFADTIGIQTNIVVKEGDLDRIVQFTGPLGLTRHAGSLGAEFAGNLSISPEGQLEISTVGTVTATNIDVASPDAGQLRLAKGTVAIDGGVQALGNGDALTSGIAVIKLEQFSGGSGDGPALGFEQAEIDLGDVRASLPQSGGIEVTAKPSVLISAAKLTGPTAADAKTIALALDALAISAGAGETRVNGSGTLELAGTNATVDGGTAARIERTKVDLKANFAAAADGSGKLDATLSADLAPWEATIAEGPRIAGDAANLSSGDLQLAMTADGGLALNSKPQIGVKKPRLSGPAEAEANALSVALGTLALETRASGTTVHAVGTVNLDSLGATVGDGVRIRLDGSKLDLDANHAGTTDGTGRLTGKLAITLDPIEATVPAGPRFNAAGTRLTLADLQLTTANDGRLTVRTKPTLALQKPRVAGPVDSGADALTLTLARLTVESGSDGTTIEGAGTSDLDRFRATVPGQGEVPPLTASIGRLTTQLNRVATSAGAKGLEWQIKGGARVETIAADFGKLGSAKLDQIRLDDLAADHRPSFAADEIAIGKLQAELTKQLITALAGPGDDKGKKKPPAPASGPQPAIRLGLISLAEGSSIRFRDSTTQPPVVVRADVKRLAVRNLDSTNPRQSADVQADLALNEFSRVELAGEVNPFGSKPNFDLVARISDLALPTFSPYVAEAIGVYMERGDLSAKADAAADAGKLAGTIELIIDGLAFETLSGEDAQRISASIGVPIDTAVGLLQDSDKRIKLTIPISGDLASPKFDVSDAINQAIGGAIQAAVTAPFQLLISPVAIAAKAVGGGGVAFQPITFEAGKTEVVGEASVLADTLGRLLKERPQLALKICGRATLADAVARGLAMPPAGQQAGGGAAEQLRAQMVELATERTRAVRRYLVDNWQVPVSRVGECRPAFEPTNDKPPRVEISF